MLKGNQSGFSLVEVMVAAGISIGMFFFLNSSMIKMQKVQSKMEKRAEFTGIVSYLTQSLSDFRAWEENPETDIPTPANDANFYMFMNRRTPIKRMSFTQKEFLVFDKNFKCNSDYPGCRVVLFDYKGRMFFPDEMTKLPAHYFIAQIGFETQTDNISRSFVPELKVLIDDIHDDPELRVSSKSFYINSGKVFDSGLSKDSEEKVDPVSKSNCILEHLKSYPGQYQNAKDLCDMAQNTMPALCFKKLRSGKNESELVAVVTCSRAVNPFPIECLETSKKMFSVAPSYLAILCSGARSIEPINCLNYIKKSIGNIEPLEYYKICARSVDESPAKCLVSLLEKSSELLETAVKVCPQRSF